jgi:hypothetical protein
MLNAQFGFFCPCASPEELQVAGSAAQAALADYRAGHGSKTLLATPLSSSSAPSLIELITKALVSYPPNQPKALLQELLAEAPVGVWVKFESIKLRFIEAGLQATQASAALRDLSWQIKQVLPAEILADMDAAICIFAERMRSGGTFNYRLTEAGRAALDRLNKN